MYIEQQYEEFAKKMETQFPLMFENKYGGFAVGAGWWPIIESLCANIQSHIDWKQEQKDQYQRGEGCSQVYVEQIKEKFGTLRFYYDGGDETTAGMVRMAEAWADHSCETCGAPGTRRNGGWIRTLCDVHEAEHMEQIKKEHDNEA